jgi:hypothetical protein
MRKILLLILACVSLSVSAQTSSTVRRLFVTANTTANTSIERMLPLLNSTEKGPVINFVKSSIVFVSPHRSISTKRLDNFYFHIEVVDGIETVTTSADAAKEGNVYNLNGQLVREHAESLDGLPQGVYIVNGRKHIVR